MGTTRKGALGVVTFHSEEDDVGIDRPRLSPTALTKSCDRQNLYRYVEGVISPPGLAMVVGSAVHKPTEKMLKAKASLADPLSPEEVADAARDAFVAEVDRRGIMLDDDETARGEAVVLGEGRDNAIRFAHHSREFVVPGITPVSPEHVERRLRLVVSTAPFDLTTILDYQTPDRLGDLKTRKAKPSVEDLRGNVQLGFEAMALEAVDGKAPATMGLDVIQTGLKGGPRSFLLTTETPTDHTPILRRIEITGKMFEAGLFPPVDPTSVVGKWACTRKFCGYFDRCPFGAARKVAVSMVQTSG